MKFTSVISLAQAESLTAKKSDLFPYFDIQRVMRPYDMHWLLFFFLFALAFL